jgi:hypothetical protein
MVQIERISTRMFEQLDKLLQAFMTNVQVSMSPLYMHHYE